MGHKHWTAAQDETLKNLYGRATRLGLMTALPTRSWMAIRRRASELGVAKAPEWTLGEERTLRRLYATSTWEMILAALPLHNKPAISQRAVRLKLQRPHGPRAAGRRLTPVSDLRAVRLSKNRTQDQVASRIGIHPNVLRSWERGYAAPRLRNLIDWAQALECTVQIVSTSERNI